MADKARPSYNYNDMANLVTTADRRFTSRRDAEPVGEAESVVGKISKAEMGSRVERAVTKPQKRKAKTEPSQVEGLAYQPATAESREVMGYILAFVGQEMGDVPNEVLTSASDAILEICKSDTLKDFDKKKSVEDVLDAGLSEQRFSLLVNLTKKITDWHEEEVRGDYEDVVAVHFSESEDEDEYDVQSEASVETESQQEHGLLGADDDGKSVDRDRSEIPMHEIDAFWLQRRIASHMQDPHEVASKTATAMAILESEDDLRGVENSLMDLFNYELFELVQVLVKNREKIVWMTRHAQAEDKNLVESQMPTAILKELKDGRTDIASQKHAPTSMEVDTAQTLQPSNVIDLEALVFEEGNHLKSSTRVLLPQGSTKSSKKSYEEIFVPAPKRNTSDEKLVSVSSLPEWTREAFKGADTLNRIQSKLYPVAFGTDENILLCAPTGAGKTNVAMLCILNELRKYREQNDNFRTDEFKIVYVAPLKALVQEMVGNFSARLKEYGIKVSELTGDQNLTKQQISETQIIVTTPEKWDVITRKATDTSYTNLVRLIIIDEIHLLHDDRGPVIESIVSRTLRKIEETGENVRLVGLSATLPNYKDVATFLRVNKKGLFYFDSTYRPCPLQMKFVGITEKKAIKRFNAMNECAYEKVMEQAGKNQVLIFVHSRRETSRTAKYIRDRALELETIVNLLKSDAASKEILETEANDVQDKNLKDLLPYGFAIHHAGMTRADRTTAEDLFAAGYAQVLVSTATLAWGVNLPAHAVIIKGTQIYSPEKGSWVELSPQDVLQMLGRAGRPQYDTFGEGTIITNNSEMEYYLSLMNQQLPIESQFVRKLVDNLNAEIVLGTVRSRDDAVQWLGYTYLYVRMLRSPALYKVGVDYGDDETLLQKRVDLVHSAALVLEKAQLITYGVETGRFQSTDLGKIASHYYISHASIQTYNRHLSNVMGEIELFRLFALSEEFKYIPVREEEKIELQKLVERVPIPIRENIDDASAKINVLLQAYMSRLKLEGFALVSDMVYVTQSAGRILRAVFEICLKRGWSAVALCALDMCKMAEKRMWPTMSPLRQFPTCPSEIIRRMERSSLPFERYFELDPAELSEAINSLQQGRILHSLLKQFPRLELTTSIQPITRSLLRVELAITPTFEWDDEVHGAAETFWLLVSDGDGEVILYHDRFLLRKRYINQEHVMEFTIPVSEPVQPHYFISAVSDRWFHAETKQPISLRQLILPEKFAAPTPLLDLQPLPASAFKVFEYEQMYQNVNFNKIQTQTFNTLFATDDCTFIGAPAGSGKTICAEFAILRHWSKANHGKAVYLLPFQELLEQRLRYWRDKFAGLSAAKEIVLLTGESSADLKLLEIGDLILATPTQWDFISRRWRQRKNIQNVSLVIADEIHMIGGHLGSTYELAVSRLRYIAAQTENPIRIVGLSVPMASGRDLGEWIGANQHSIYNFTPASRSSPLEIHIQPFTIPHVPSMMLSMTKPVFISITAVSETEQAIVFVSSRKQCRQTATEFINLLGIANDDGRFLLGTVENIKAFIGRVQDAALRDSLAHGIGMYHEALSKTDKALVEQLFDSRAVQVLLATREVCWQLTCTAPLVIVMGTQWYEGKEHRYVDYPISEMLEMLAKTSRPGDESMGRAIIMTNGAKKAYYQKFLSEALPVESHLHNYLTDAFVTEISTKTIESRQDAVDWTTFTYFYRRLLANPSFYGVIDVSNQGLSEYLSELVEGSLKELADANIISIEEDEDEVAPLNGAMIAAYYNISFITVQTFILSLSGRTKLKGLLEIVTSASEFETIPIRRHEDSLLARLYNHLPVKLAEANFESPHFKAFILLQAHFSRMTLPPDLSVDQSLVLQQVLNLLSAAVDVMSSEGYLNAMLAMDMSQMCVQAIWNNDSPLKQIPHFTNELIDACKKAGVENVSDIMNLEDEERNALLHMDSKRLARVAKFTNKYPDVDLSFALENDDKLEAGSIASLNVALKREIDEDEELDTIVHAPFFPRPKTENWWIVLGDPATKQLLAIKKVTLARRLSVKLDFSPSRAGRHELKLYLISDSYAGVDQELDFEVVVGEGAVDGEENDEMEM